MSTRRQAREYTLRMLYAADNCNMATEDIYRYFDAYLPKIKTYREFILDLFRGVCENKEKIDSMIKQYAENWEINRMVVVDRNIMRLAAYEIMTAPDIPIGVIIDEAVEISKKYSTEDSSKFVNGILDKFKNIRTR